MLRVAVLLALLGGTVASDTHCIGTEEVKGNKGIITHNPAGGEYAFQRRCAWRIIPDDPNANIRFKWGADDVAIQYGDLLQILHGVQDASPVQKTFTGISDEGVLYSEFPQASVVFESDDADFPDEPAHFTIEWEALTCFNDCGGGLPGGECLPEPQSDGTCAACPTGTTGPGCALQPCTGKSCGWRRGVCGSDGICQCQDTFFGPKCKARQCSGHQTYTTASGVLTHGKDRSYSDNSRCSFFVNPAAENLEIALSLDEFELEDGRDFVYVYDDLQHTNLLATFTGDLTGTSRVFKNYPALNLVFESDEANQGKGFQISYTSGVYPTVVPGFDQQQYFFTFFADEMSVKNQVLGRVTATHDSGPVTYSLTNFRRLFFIEPNGTLKGWKNYKQEAREYNLNVQACSVTGQCSSVNVRVRILDENGCLASPIDYCAPPPEFSGTPYEFEFLGDESNVGATIGQVAAVDETKGTMTYRLLEYTETYNIDAVTGEVTLEAVPQGLAPLPVEACSRLGCSTVEVQLLIYVY